MRGTLLGIVVVLLAATPAAAVIQYGGPQNREVRSAAGPVGFPGDEDLDDETGTGIWIGSVASAHSDTPPPPLPGGGSASASATQVSNLGDFEISMAGELAGAGAGNDPPDFCCWAGTATSFLGASFKLDSDAPYVSTLVSTADSVQFSFSNQSTSYDANSSGVLPAGVYNLTITFQSSNGVFPGAFSDAYAYNLTIVPEPSSVCLILVGAMLAAASRPRNGRR